MIQFTATIQQFGSQGEKTGWSYILVTAAQAQKLKPDNKRSFRVKGKLDEVPISKMSLLPMGDGDFILALKATIRKALRKQKGDKVRVQLEVDNIKIAPPKDLLECLADEPEALLYFRSLTPSHQNYFGNYVRAAKTEGTRTRRLVQIVTALQKKWDYGQMIRNGRAYREEMGE